MAINAADFGSPPERLQQFPAGRLASQITQINQTFSMFDSLKYMGVKIESFDNTPSLMANTTPGTLHATPIAGLNNEAYNGELTISFK